MKKIRRRLVQKFMTALLLFNITCAKPVSDTAGTGFQLMTGSEAWLQELGKLKNPRGVLPTGTNFTATNISYDTWGTSYEFFAFDDNVSLILLSNSPLYFIKIESREMQYHLKSELAQLPAVTPTNKQLNSITFYKEVGDYSVEIYFTPKELDFVLSGINKDKIGDKNSTTYPDLDLWKLSEAANNVTFYTPSFDNQKIADDFYSQYLASKRRLILADSSTITNPVNYNLKSYGLNFSFMIGSDLTVTDDLLGSQDIRFVDRFALTRSFAAFFSVPVNNGATGLSQKNGIAVIVRGDMTNIRNFISAQGVNLDEAPVVPAYKPPATLMFTEVSPNISSSFDLIELKVTAAGSLSGMVVQANASSATNFITFPDVSVSVGDIIVVHCNGATEAGAAPGHETTAKNQYPVGTYAANFDNAWDFQGSANGITATDTTLLVCSGVCSSSTVQDSIVLSNKDGTGSATFDGNLATIQGYGAWSPANCGGAACSDASTPSSQTVAAPMNGVGTTRTGASVQRRNTGSYVDTNQSSDWTVVGTATFGTDTVVTDGVAPTVGGGGTITPSVVSFSQIDLSWTAATDNITAQGSLIYEICQSTSSTGCNTFTATYTNGAGVVTRSVTGLSSNTLYYFVVRVRDAATNTALYTQTSATTLVNSDVTAPSAVSTLAAGTVTSTSIQLNWTSVGDDNLTGTATSYEMRYLSAGACPINAGNFATGTLVASMPAPQANGNAETKTVTGLTASTSYCFAIKVSDEVPNQSAISNIVTQSTSAAVSTATLMITEVSPNITSSFDLVEIKVISGGTLTGLRLQQNTTTTPTTIITFPAVTVLTGDIIVVHGTGATEPGAAPGSESTAKNQYPVGTYSANYDNAWDFHGTAGLTATDITLLICNTTCVGTNVQDGIALSNKDGASSATFLNNITDLQAQSAWTPVNCGGIACTDATTPTAQTISGPMNGVGTTKAGNSTRRTFAGSYTDTNQASDWTVGTSSFGVDN